MNASLRISNPTRIIFSKSHRQTLSATRRNLHFHNNKSRFGALAGKSISSATSHSHHHHHHHHHQSVSFFKSDPNDDFLPINGGGAVTVPGDGNRLVTAVLLGWLGAEPKHLKRYAEMYNSRGMTTLSFVVPVSEMLWFDLGRNIENRIERLANDVVSWLMESDKDGRERCLVFHTFSNTGWLVYGAIMRHLHGKPELMKRVKGCIVDSGGDPEINPKVWAVGFATAILKKRSSSLSPVGEIGEMDPISSVPKIQQKEPGLIESLLLFMLEKIFSFFLNWPDINQRLSIVIASVSEDGPSCPQLYLYSTADTVILSRSVESFMEEQRRMGRKVWSFNFQSSSHVDHYRTFPDLYSSTVSSFLDECLTTIKHV